MRLLLTADVHLEAGRPERRAALEAVLDRCEAENVDVLLIAGDLFDADVDVEDVKPGVRDLFSDNDFRTLVIPGNHDQTAFREEDYFGDDIEVLRAAPFEKRDLGAVNLVAVPYFDGEFSDVLDGLATASEDGGRSLLLLHCTLAGLGGGFGAESRYLPVTPEQLSQLSFDYVFAGHVHSSPTKRRIGAGTVFVYPGSPVSITRRETGRRGVWLLDTEAADDGQLRKLDLDTFHYETVRLELRPGEATAQLETLASRLEATDLENAHLVVEPVGFIEREEGAFLDELERTLSGFEPSRVEIDRTGFRSVRSIVRTDLYQQFRETLEGRDDVDRTAVERMALEAYARYDRG